MVLNHSKSTLILLHALEARPDTDVRELTEMVS